MDLPIYREHAVQNLREQVRRDQLASFVRLKGGFPFPLAGAVYWLALGVAGSFLTLRQWNLAAFIFSGAIFPLAILLSKIFRSDFMKDRTATGDVLAPAFTAMLLFYAVAFPALGYAPELVPLIVAVGMSQHWPVIGWSYGKPALYSAHAVIRALGAAAIWVWLPDGRLTLLPFWVAAVYLATVAAIIVAWRREAAARPA
ncbi:MAG TPA: hypothetical protein VMG08_18250 [Allosphingosinicella sp.]|nr:hypothetical protein [Allosphingosinicella sp.]